MSISIHAPPRGATLRRTRFWQPARYFNSRPSARGDTSRKVRNQMRAISIHAPPRGATERVGYRIRRNRFQFTPLREGRQMVAVCERANDLISIHAPPRGATQAYSLIETGKRISIHAPPRGATVMLLAHLDKLVPISIHAPPRGATRGALRLRAHPADFNSRPSARGDICTSGRLTRRWYFNSRPSARGDAKIAKKM